MGDNEVAVLANAIEHAAAAMAPAETELESFGASLEAACAAAAGAAGEGPLAGVLSAFGDDASKRCAERGAECRELAQALGKTLDALRENDDRGADAMGSLSFGGVTG